MEANKTYSEFEPWVSDVYLKTTPMGDMNCIACRLAGRVGRTEHGTVVFQEIEDVLAHLKEHDDAGHLGTAKPRKELKSEQQKSVRETKSSARRQRTVPPTV